MKYLQFPGLLMLPFLLLFAGLVRAEFQLTTESYPPFNMNDANGEITGISTEIVREIFKRNKLDYTISLLPWNRAYSMATEKPNIGVFSTTRTPEREALFKWVSPLTLNNWVFLSRKDRNIQLKSFADAKKYRVGGYRGDAIALYLEKQGFELDLVRKDDLNAVKLARGRIDLWATGHLLGPYIAKQKGVTGLTESLTFKKTVLGLAFHPDTPSKVIDALNKSLRDMAKDGTIRAIYGKYH